MDFRVRISGSHLPPAAVKTLIVILIGAALIGLGAPINNSPAWLVGMLPLFAMVSIALILAGSRASERVRVIGVLLVCIVITACAVYTTLFTSNASTVWLQVLVCLGIGLVYGAFRARDGGTLHCALCDYPFNEARVCPECGSDWSQTNTLRRGTRRRRPWMAVLGGVIIVTGVLLLTSPLLTRAAWTIAPTSLLLDLGGRVAPPEGVFAALNRRMLTPEERLDLAGRLIDQSDAPAGLTSQQADWLAITAKMNLLPAPLADRYFRDGLKLSLRVEGPAIVGESIRVELTRGNLLPTSPLAMPVSAWLTGWWVDDGKVADAWADWDSTTRFDESLLQTLPTSGPTHLPGITITPSTPGTVTVRVVVWLVAAPSRPTLVLNPDGTPRFGSNSTPIWTRRVELVKQIEVIP